MVSKITPPASSSRADRLYELAAAQEGHFTTAQAAEVGYSPQLLAKYLANGRIVRIRRGVYRLVHFPPGEHEDLVVIWLWSERQGIFSHETALALQGLSDALPSRVHLTCPERWKKRRFRLPPGVVLHYGDVHAADRAWVGAIPLTKAARTVLDCAADHLDPILVSQAIDEGMERGLFSPQMVKAAADYVSSFKLVET